MKGYKAKQFIRLGTPHQLSKLCIQTVTLGGIRIQISTETIWLSVCECCWIVCTDLGTSCQTFVQYSNKSFYHLKTVRRSFIENVAKTMVPGQHKTRFNFFKVLGFLGCWYEDRTRKYDPKAHEKHHIYRVGQKTGLFLKVCNSCICWHRIAFYIPNCSVFYPE